MNLDLQKLKFKFKFKPQRSDLQFFKSMEGIVAIAFIVMMLSLPVLMFIDYLIQEVFAPTSMRGGAHCSGCHFHIHKNYRVQRGR